MAKYKFYVVRNGRRPGIYNNWHQCQEQVNRFPGADYEGFQTLKDAETSFGRPVSCHPKKPRKLTLIARRIEHVVERPKEYIIVDGACDAFGTSEFQGFIFPSNERIFHQGKHQDSSNNIAEFLAIAHALYYCKARNIKLPIYSDSTVAIGWIKNRKARTWQAETIKNTHLLKEIRDAEKWLEENEYPNKIFKWETKQWGENPADFGNKQKKKNY